jgi:hypothetical protein
MTARAEYTTEEWTLLQMTPFAVGLAMSFADGSGVLETFNEVAALATERTRGAGHYPGNELVAALLADRGQPAAPVIPPAIGGAAPTDLGSELRARAIEGCRAVVALLEDRSSADEADGYKRFLMDIARVTAMASRHGGWLSRGPAIDEQERSLLRDLSDVLGVDVGEVPDGVPPRDVAPSMDGGGGQGIPTGPISPE